MVRLNSWLDYIDINIEMNKNEKIGIAKIESERDPIPESKLYDDLSHRLICPQCKEYKVKFVKRTEKWFCDKCQEYVDYDKINISEQNKYKIYRNWGIEAIHTLTNEPLDDIKKFVGMYFKNCCLSKKECLYQEYFDDSEEKLKIIL